MEELNQTRKQFEQLKKTHVNTNKKLTELKQRVLEKNVISNKNKQKSMENEMDAANTYSSLANVLPSNDKQEKNTQVFLYNDCFTHICIVVLPYVFMFSKLSCIS